MPGWEERFRGQNTDLERLLNAFADELGKSGFKVKVNRKRMSLEATLETPVDKSWGQVVVSGTPNDFTLRMDWDADLRKLFWVDLASKASRIVSSVSSPPPAREVASWSPAEEITGEAPLGYVHPELAELRRKVEVELDGKRSVFLAQADTLEREGNVDDAAVMYLKAAVISRELGEKVYAEEFERRAEELKRSKKK
ncbi:MAG: hypothetical protein ACTSWP_00120 [Candidatus Freyarchaeota archaeon]|nr:hypothetical protein [Candidatus Freyrarchaeum guaymaensis]HDO80364.1 hypothetical protein [Candidatus Bathyarchaeota archaeon]